MSGFRDKTLDGGHLAKGTMRETDRGVPTLALCRHAMLVDQKTESVVIPLNTALAPQGKLELANSE
jgi:2-oxoglutarate dehydrogenase complex dehydrogenase (E1) component-like enzyme